MNATVANTVSQGILAKLLATENIQVHVGNYRTAFFDVKNRILGLPSWNVSDKNVSDLLIGHEVGHALYTPPDSLVQFKAAWPHIPFSILNVVEDIRIERLIQKRYPGLITSFNRGYEEFLKRDFFKIAGKDVNKMNFADRLNIKGKLRHLIDVNFNPDEQAIFDRCLAAETMNDVVGIVLDIYEMIKKEKANKDVKLARKKVSVGGTQNETAGPQSTEEDDEYTSSPSGETDVDDKDDETDIESEREDEHQSTQSNDSEDTTDDVVDSSTNDEDDVAADDSSNDEDENRARADKGSDATEEREYRLPDDELNSTTSENLSESLSHLYTNFGKNKPIIMPSKHHLEASVVGWKAVMEDKMSHPKFNERITNSLITADWVSFRKTTRKNIQQLISDFERKKAAYQYSRSRQTDSGDLDLNKLHCYKFDEQIFRSITKLADAKSHGMMFFIDYSGSMAFDIFNVLEHTLNLVMFCKAVGIPFQVFGFTNQLATAPTISVQSVLNNQISLHDTSVFELIASDMDSKTFELACRVMRAQCLVSASGYLASKWEVMSGTPLNETLIVAHDLVAKFRKKYPVQKMNVLILSDGEGQEFRFGYDKISTDNIVPSSGYHQTRYVGQLAGREIILNPADTNKNYAALVKSLREVMGCTVVGFFITRQRNNMKKTAIASIRYSTEHGATLDKMVDWQHALALAEKELKWMRKNKCAFIRDGYNYNCYFLIDARDAKIERDDEFRPSTKVSDEETLTASVQNKLAKEFTKYTVDKKSSRIILGKFAEIIA